MIQLIIYILSQCLFNVINAYFDAYRFLKNKTVAHGLNFGLYAAVVGSQLILPGYQWWYMVIFCLSAFFCRQVTFDIPLNWRRKLKWNYVSLDKPPKPITDRIEISVFGYNGTAITGSYIVLWLVFNASLFLIKYFL